MKQKFKKIIAREGLILLPVIIIAWIYSAGVADGRGRTFITGKFFGSFLIFMFSYVAIRFVIWGIRTLKEKE